MRRKYTLTCKIRRSCPIHVGCYDRRIVFVIPHDPLASLLQREKSEAEPDAQNAFVRILLRRGPVVGEDKALRRDLASF